MARQRDLNDCGFRDDPDGVIKKELMHQQSSDAMRRLIGHRQQKFRIVFEIPDECSANGLAACKTKAKNFL
jgi:hypothetical protein